MQAKGDEELIDILVSEPPLPQPVANSRESLRRRPLWRLAKNRQVSPGKATTSAKTDLKVF